MKLNFIGGGKYGLRQKRAAYKGHLIWRDVGFSGRPSFTIDNTTQPRLQTAREAKAYIDQMSGSSNPKRVRVSIRKGKGGYSIKFLDPPYGVASWFPTKQRAKDYVSSGEWHRVMRKSNPAAALPIGRTITVKAIRRRDGRVDLYRA